MNSFVEIVCISLYGMGTAYAISFWGPILSKLPPIMAAVIQYSFITLPQTAVLIFPNSLLHCFLFSLAIAVAGFFASQQ